MTTSDWLLLTCLGLCLTWGWGRGVKVRNFFSEEVQAGDAGPVSAPMMSTSG